MENIKLETILYFFENGIYTIKDLNFLKEKQVLTDEDVEYLISKNKKKVRKIEEKIFTFEVINTKSRNSIFKNESLEETLKVFPPEDREEIFVIRDLNGRIKYLESASIIRSNLGIPESVSVEEVARIQTEIITQQENSSNILPETLKVGLGILEEIKKREVIEEIKIILNKILERVS